MTTDYFLPQHVCQLDAANSTVTRRSGCTWSSLTSGIRAISGGRYNPTPDKIHSLVASTEETSPTTPGWSIPDAKLAASRFGVRLEDRSGKGWAGVTDALLSGHYVILQGDSDQFGSSTCSGDFDGDHCIGVSPQTKVEDGVRWFYINDPICPGGRWAKAGVLRRYAEDFYAPVHFGVFTQLVPHYEWRWKNHVGFYQRYFDVDRSARTWRSMKRVATVGTRAYRCTAPETYDKAGPEKDPRDIVKLGVLATGNPGPKTGQWVGAGRADRVLVG